MAQSAFTKLKNKSRKSTGHIGRYSTLFYWSGWQDLNLRPFGPEQNKPQRLRFIYSYHSLANIKYKWEKYALHTVIQLYWPNWGDNTVWTKKAQESIHLFDIEGGFTIKNAEPPLDNVDGAKEGL
jgi:hypothetical protein